MSDFEKIFGELRIGPMPESPSPESVTAEMVAIMKKVAARNPKNWVYVYSPLIAEDQAITTSEDMNLDGKRHVFLNPKHQPEIDKFLASVADEDV